MERDIKITGMRCHVSTLRKQRSVNGKIDPPQPLTIEEKRKKRIAALARVLCLLAKKPSLYITLMIPGKCCDVRNYDNFREIFDSFTRRIKYEFKNCWFIYKFEYTQRVGFHVHMLGNLFRREKLNFNVSKHEIVSQLWNKSIESYFEIVPYNVTPCLVKECNFYIHGGYLTKPSKKNNDIEYIRKSDGAQTWNYINKKNISFAKLIHATLTEKAYDIFIRILKDELCNTGYNIKYIDRVMHKKFASFSFIDNDILLKSISGACKEANDGSAVHDI